MEGRIFQPNGFRSKPLAGKVRDFGGSALLDRNPTAIGCSHIHGGPRRGYIERNPMLFRQHRNRIGSNLLGHITLGGNAVRPDHHSTDLSLHHIPSPPAVGVTGLRNPFFLPLPSLPSPPLPPPPPTLPQPGT